MGIKEGWGMWSYERAEIKRFEGRGDKRGVGDVESYKMAEIKRSNHFIQCECQKSKGNISRRPLRS